MRGARNEHYRQRGVANDGFSSMGSLKLHMTGIQAGRVIKGLWTVLNEVAVHVKMGYMIWIGCYVTKGSYVSNNSDELWLGLTMVDK